MGLNLLFKPTQTLNKGEVTKPLIFKCTDLVNFPRHIRLILFKDLNSSNLIKDVIINQESALHNLGNSNDFYESALLSDWGKFHQHDFPLPFRYIRQR